MQSFPFEFNRLSKLCEEILLPFIFHIPSMVKSVYTFTCEYLNNSVGDFIYWLKYLLMKTYSQFILRLSYSWKSMCYNPSSKFTYIYFLIIFFPLKFCSDVRSLLCSVYHINGKHSCGAHSVFLAIIHLKHILPWYLIKLFIHTFGILQATDDHSYFYTVKHVIKFNI